MPKPQLSVAPLRTPMFGDKGLERPWGDWINLLTKTAIRGELLEITYHDSRPRLGVFFIAAGTCQQL